MLEGDSEMKQLQIMKKPILPKIWLNLFITDIRCIIFLTQESKEITFCQIIRFGLAYLNSQVKQYSYECTCFNKAGGQNSLSTYVKQLSSCIKLLRLELLRKKYFPVDILGWKIGSLRPKKWRPSVYPIIEAAWGQTLILLLPIQPAPCEWELG